MRNDKLLCHSYIQPGKLRDTSGYWSLPAAAMREAGVTAAKVLGAFYNVAGKRRESYHRLKLLADAAAVSQRTLRRALQRLVATGWLIRRGRQRRGTRKRRTVTYALTVKALRLKKPFYPWPRWLSTDSASAGAVYAILLWTACRKNHRDVAVSCAALSEATGLSCRQMLRAISHLVETAKLKRRPVNGQTTVYRLTIPAELKQHLNPLKG